MATIKSRYVPRPWFMPFHLRKQRWSLMVAHRRAGKTVAAVNDLIEKASYNTREAPRYGYIGPMLKQAKQIAWEYLKRFAEPYTPKISESELWVELSALPNSPRITIYGADNPDSFRGLYFDGVVLDEYGNMAESVWGEVLLPALVDRRGWAVFMGTPNGPNHFRDAWYKYEDDPSWFRLMKKVSDTKIISEEDLAEMRKLMEPEEYEQEMMCNFEASVRGAIFARQMEIMEQEGRIGDQYVLDKSRPVDVAYDLGFTDTCTLGFWQQRFDGIVVGHSWGDNFKPIDHYIDYQRSYLRDAGLQLGRVFLPHDAKAKTLQTGLAIVDHFRKAGIRPKLVPRLDKIDQIAAARTTFPKVYLNKTQNKTLILGLKSYHRKYDEDLKRYSDEPVHDWSSHWADMFMYGCISENPKAIEKKDQSSTAQRRAAVVDTGGQGLHYSFALNDIWDLTPRSSRRRYG